MELKRQNWILVDFENVQQVEFDRLRGLPVSVLLFLGPHQNKLPTTLVTAAIRSGVTFDILQLDQAGPNAVDMAIAFSAGDILAKDSQAFIHILSKDRDYDCLVRFIRASGRLGARAATFPELRFLIPPTDWTKSDLEVRVQRAFGYLKANSKNRPRKVGTLKAALGALFAKQLPEPAIDEIYALLAQKKVLLTDEKGLLTYLFTD